MIKFGKSLQDNFLLDWNYTYTNHGSYGAVMKSVVDIANKHRKYLHSNPQLYYSKKLPIYIEENANVLGEYLGVSGTSIAFTRSATESMNAVLRSLSLLAGDEIITDINVYPSTARVLDFVCGRASARYVKVSASPFITSIEEYVDSYIDLLTPRTRLVILEDVAASTGLIQPIERIIEECNRRGIAVLVDGAHAVGVIPRNLAELRVDWYVGCLHKWLGVERGVGYIYASEARKDTLRPMNISRSYYEPFPNNFDWPGTGDFSAWLTVKDAIAIRNEEDAKANFEYCHDLIMWAGNYTADELGTSFIVPERFVACMAPVELPEVFQSKKISVQDIMLALMEKKIMSKIELINGVKYVRLSAYVYNDEEDYKILIQGIKDIIPQFEK